MNTTKDQRRDQRHLMKILKANDYEGVKLMIKEKSIDLNFLDSRLYCSPLMLEAARKKPPCIQMMQFLLDHGARINFRDSLGMTALHLLACNTTRRCNDRIIFLLNHGANPNALSNNGDSPLHRACFSVNTNAVRCLLEFSNDRRDQSSILQNEGMTDSNVQPIDVNSINDDGNTPLMLATDNVKVRAELVEILFQYKAEINLVNKQKCSALHFASLNGTAKVANLLLHRGADVNIVNDDDMTPLECACLLRYEPLVRSLLTFNADANRKNRHGRTILHLLADANYFIGQRPVYKCFMLLLANGANVNIQDHNGETPLSYAVRRCCRICDICGINLISPPNIPPNIRMYLSIIILLLDEKSDINIQLCNTMGNLVNGDTILHYAVKHRNVSMVRIILSYDPDLHLRNCLQESPKDVAIKKLDANKDDGKFIKILGYINRKMATIRIKSYSYLFQSWIMSDGELELLHRKGHEITHVPCPVPTKKCRQKLRR